MKKELLLSMILLNIGVITLNAQITIRETNIVEKPVFKPQKFDSLTNFVMQKQPTDYKKYFGYKLFFLPKSKNYKPKSVLDNKVRIIDFLFSNDSVQIIKNGKIPFYQTALGIVYGDSTKLKGDAVRQYNESKKKYENIDKEKTNIYLPYFYYEKTNYADGEIYGEIGTFPDSVEGKYFTILDIKGLDIESKMYNSKEYKKLEDIDLENHKNWGLSLKITLRNESNKDTLYWIVRQARFIDKYFFLVPYFEKQKIMYLNQSLVYRANQKLENLIDVNTGAAVDIKYGDIWTCSDISFVDSKDSYYLKGFYFLKNGEKEVKIELGSDLISDNFILEKELKIQELEKQKKEEEKILEEQEQEKIKQQANIKFKNDCIAKWGQKMGGYIADSKVVLGMNKEMCTASWGNPIDINRTIISGLTSEQWVYGWGTYLYFDNGILTAIQD